MERYKAKELAETTTTAEIQEMLNNALNSIQDWSKPSRSNAGVNLFQAMNLFTNILLGKSELDEITKTNMIHCFGDYLPLKMEDVVELEEWEIDLPIDEWFYRNSQTPNN